MKRKRERDRTTIQTQFENPHVFSGDVCLRLNLESSGFLQAPVHKPRLVSAGGESGGRSAP
jgi:hypothetical protein